MTGSLWPTRCPLDGSLLEVEASPLGEGLKRRACPVPTCDFVSPSYKPPRLRRPNGRQGRQGRQGRRAARREPVTSGSGSWARNDYWQDADERGDA